MNKAQRLLLGSISALGLLAGLPGTAQSQTIITPQVQTINDDDFFAIIPHGFAGRGNYYISGKNIKQTLGFAPPLLFESNVSGSMVADGAIVSIQNSPLTAAALYTVFNPIIHYSGVRTTIQNNVGSHLGEAEGFGAYLYSSNPREHDSSGHVTFQNNTVGFFAVDICGAPTGIAYCWGDNYAMNDSVFNNPLVHYPSVLVLSEWDITVRDIGTVANGLSILANFKVEPLSGVAISIDTLTSLGQFDTVLNIGPGSTKIGHDAVIIGAETHNTDSIDGSNNIVPNVPALGVGIDSNSIALGYTNVLDGANPPYVINTPGSGCTGSGIYQLVGGTLGINYPNPATVNVTVTGGAATAISFQTASGYVNPGIPSPVTLAMFAGTGGGFTCSVYPTITPTWLPAGDAIEMWATANRGQTGNFFFRDGITQGTLSFSLGGNMLMFASNPNLLSTPLTIQAKSTPASNAWGSVALTPFGKYIQTFNAATQALPTCSGGATLYEHGVVTDATATTPWSTYAGGGSNVVIVFCNGSAWKII